MLSLYKRILHIFLVACLCTLILACSKISQGNFEKIQSNMTMKEVIGILGEPTNSESITIAGISGTSAVWKDKDAEIDIQFLNDKVTVKSFSKSNDDTNNKPHPKSKL